MNDMASTDAHSPCAYYSVIPRALLHGLNEYVEHHVETGGFLRAVLEDKLLDAVVQADDESRKVLLQIVHYVHNEIPSACHGSPEKVRAWLSPQVRDADVLRRLGEQGDGRFRVEKVTA